MLPKKVVEVAPAETKALKQLAKLTAAGPAMGDMLAAVDKLGNGPGAKNARSSFKLSGLVGKAPIANAGLGTFGLGGGGKGGIGTLGAEILRGRGGGGIGAMGAGGVGKGAVGGMVTQATSRSVGVPQGNIDRDAVAKCINSHLQEVRGCYERALIKDPGLAGKVVLEWTISQTGSVATAKTKSSSLRNSAVESCILSTLKTWQFPKPRGGVVIISYPFLFNSVGF
jgi:TonB family protein